VGRVRGRDRDWGGQVIFGRKRQAEVVVDDVDDVDAEEQEQSADADELIEEASTDEVDPDVALDEADEPDWRADGPFDYDEVDLGDDVVRIDLETLIVTPWDGLGLQLQVDEQSRAVQAVTGVWEESGLEVVLFAAPASGGLSAELREEAIEEAAEAGGSAEVVDGPFGPEIRRVLPAEGPKGEQLFHVSRVWFAEGPRWLVRGTLLGEAALESADAAKIAPFLEFYRNLVVHRGNKPMVPGERIAMKLPEGAA
jgi:hypothetical protein